MIRIKKTIFYLLTLSMIVMLSACAQDSQSDGQKKGQDTSTIVMYDGHFSEMRLIHEMVKILVEEHTDLTVDLRDEMYPPALYDELVRGTSQIMNSHDGTVLTTFLHLDPKDVPEGKTLYDFTNEKAAEQGLRMLDKIGTNNTYTIAVRKETAEQYNLEKISDLAPVAGELVFGAEHDFFTEEGSAKYTQFVEAYGLSFESAKQIEIGLKYSAIQSSNLDVTIVYATDGLNKDAELVVLEDDLQFFPEYNGALLVREDVFETFAEVAPNLEEVLNKLGGQFTDEVMQELTYEVDINGRTESEVAQEFLQSKGLLP